MLRRSKRQRSPHLGLGRRQWIAEQWNRKAFGRTAGPNVVVDVGQLMLAALQAPPPPLELAPLAPVPALTAEAEVISIE